MQINASDTLQQHHGSAPPHFQLTTGPIYPMSNVNFLASVYTAEFTDPALNTLNILGVH